MHTHKHTWTWNIIPTCSLGSPFLKRKQKKLTITKQHNNKHKCHPIAITRCFFIYLYINIYKRTNYKYSSDVRELLLVGTIIIINYLLPYLVPLCVADQVSDIGDQNMLCNAICRINAFLKRFFKVIQRLGNSQNSNFWNPGPSLHP